MNDDLKIESKEDKGGSNPNLPLHAVYFYYMLYDAGGTYTIKVYYWESNTPSGNLHDLCVRMAENAVTGGSAFDYKGSNFDVLERKRKGYFVIALDGAAFKADNPVIFNCDDASDPASKGNNGKHTFDFNNRFAEPVQGRPISFVTYKSHAKSHKDKDNLNEREYEHFMIKFEGTLTAQSAAAPPYIYDDSGGTNMGPPPAPPFVADI